MHKKFLRTLLIVGCFTSLNLCCLNGADAAPFVEGDSDDDSYVRRALPRTRAGLRAEKDYIMDNVGVHVYNPVTCANARSAAWSAAELGLAIASVGLAPNPLSFTGLGFALEDMKDTVKRADIANCKKCTRYADRLKRLGSVWATTK